MLDNEAVLKFVSDTEGVDEGFKKVDRGLDDIEQKARGASEGVKSFFAVFSGSLVAGAVSEFARQIAGAIGDIPEALQRGSAIDDAIGSFNALAQQAGVVGDVLIGNLSTALSDTIPKVELMQKATELLLGGLKPDQIELVAKAARSFGEATGKSASEGMDAFADSLLRGNDRALKVLGITVDNEQALYRYAKAVGVATEDLTELQKVEAIRNASLDALAANTEKLGAVTDDTGDVIDQIAAAFQNSKDEALRMVSTNDDVKESLEDIRDAIRETDFTPLLTALTEVARLGAEATSALIAFANGTSGIDKYLVKFSSGFKTVQEDLRGISLTLLDGTAAAVQKAAADFDDLRSRIAKTGNSSLFATVKSDLAAMELVIKSHAKDLGILSGDVLPKLQGENRKTGETFNVLTKAEKEAAERAKEIAAFTDKYREALEKQRDELVKAVTGTDRYKIVLDNLKSGLIDSATAGKEISEIYKEADAAQNELIASTSIYNGLLDAQRRGASVAAEDIGNAAQAMRDAQSAVSDLAKSTGGTSFLDLLVGEGLDPGQSQVASMIGSALSSAITAAIGGNDVSGAIKSAGLSMGQALGAAAGASLGPIGSAVGGALGQALADKFISGVSGAGKSSKGTGKAAKTILDGLFPGVGSGLDFLVGDRLFGNSEGTETRKKIDKYFADLFDAKRLAVIIDGQLQEIKDLDLGGGLFGDSSSAASGFFDALGSEAQTAFSAIAQGFASILDVGNEAAIGLAEALASNLGGSLNNLQLLVEATGVSFEDLKEQAVNAFLDGKLSALEAQTVLNGIAQVSQKGIPDGLGLISQAFDNIKAAGTKGGRALIDALQDVGYEAKELGIKDLAQVQQQLAATGKYSAAEIAQVFDELKKNGITSVDQLTSATTEQLLPVLAQLENTKFPFAEQVKDVRDYIDAVDKIPTSKDVQLNIKVNYQNSADQKVVQQMAGQGSFGQGQATL